MTSSSSRVNRRCFLSTSFALGACALRTSAVRAIEPLQREGCKFKFSLAAYSYRRLLQGDPPELTLFDFIDDCARFGLEGTELTSYYFPKQVTTEYLNQLKHACFLRGLDISGTAVGNDFGLPEGDKRTQQIEHVKQWITYAQQLGAPVIRIFAGHRVGDATDAETHRRIVDGIQECCASAARGGVHLALENHGGPTSTADGLLAIVRDVDSPWFGVNLDTGNFRSTDVYRDMERVAPYALNVQVKVAVSGPAGGQQPMDFMRLAKILRNASYRGYVVLEFEEQGDPRSECPRYLDELRGQFAAL